MVERCSHRVPELVDNATSIAEGLAKPHIDRYSPGKYGDQDKKYIPYYLMPMGMNQYGMLFGWDDWSQKIFSRTI